MTPTMDATVAEPRLAQILRMGPSPSQLGLVFALAAGLTLAAGVVMWAMRPSMVPLYTSLSDRDAGEIINVLRSRHLPFEVDGSSGMILVPGERLQELRMQLSADGLPNDRDLGLEALKEDQSVGTTIFMEQARYHRMLEVELSRTVARTRGVEAARVHLAIPKQTSFVRDRSRPSASVMLKLAPGRVLDAGQVEGIVNMVASSVPNLELSRVAVVDQHGRLLSRDTQGGDMAASNRQFEYKREVERDYATRIEELLFPMLGPGRVRAQVHAEMDLAAAERREEAFAGAPEKVRSEQIQDQRNTGSQALGVPGALTNQPPEGGSLQQDGDGEAAGGSASYNKNTTRNFELDKTITHTRILPGRVTRLSVAVLVDDRVTINAEGETVRTPLEQAELDGITGLVKEAVGFNAERGDTVQVINRSFQPPAELEAPPVTPMWEEMWFTTLVKYALAAVLMLLLMLMVLRPVVRTLTRRDQSAVVDTEGDTQEGAGDLALLESDRLSLSSDASDMLPAPPRVYGDILNLAREMATDDPKRVATVLRKWMEADDE